MDRDVLSRIVAEHLRQHERVTVEDQASEDQVRMRIKVNTTPVVSHLIWGITSADDVAIVQSDLPAAQNRGGDTSTT